MEETKVKIIRDGDQQMVVLPEKLHLADEEVYAVQIGTSVMLYTRPKSWEEWWNGFGAVSDDFMPERDQPTEHQVRESLND